MKTIINGIKLSATSLEEMANKFRRVTNKEGVKVYSSKLYKGNKCVGNIYANTFMCNGEEKLMEGGTITIDIYHDGRYELTQNKTFSPKTKKREIYSKERKELYYRSIREEVEVWEKENLQPYESEVI